MKPITKDITQDAFERMQAMLKDDEERNRPQKKVNLLLTPVQKNKLYHVISDLIKSNEDRDSVVKSIVVYLDEFLKEKHEEQNSKENIPKGAVFRRVE